MNRGDLATAAARIRAAWVPGRECRLRPRRARIYVLRVARLDAAGLIRPDRALAVAARAEVLAEEMEGARCPTSTET
ncbi:hypothetical protein MKK55_18135 [Methylobacterium sp. J-059]|uniref:hypothetical protein n=1 Tax=Methylobacterium sp. J-059 TaxID=2836643 RepID=UPI001FBBD6CB|nr:hypothetical protein [Methylobacterium sp. J-059]MCJ2040852.1 hypothetical protein [Methylobacterium sp. J-059]